MDNAMKGLIALLALLFLGGIGLYLANLDEPISTVRATRPVLVFTLIVAMLGFGGMLMAKSLFGHEAKDEFEPRFRLAREIFLVYAGIFGTIIGFYFGAADEGDVTVPPSASVAVRGRAVSAQISGGLPPFVAYLQQSDPKLDVMLQVAGNERLLTAELDGDAPCPDQATLYVVDGRGRRGSFDVSAQSIVGWPELGCGDRAPAGAETPAGAVRPSG